MRTRGTENRTRDPKKSTRGSRGYHVRYRILLHVLLTIIDILLENEDTIGKMSISEDIIALPIEHLHNTMYFS